MGCCDKTKRLAAQQGFSIRFSDPAWTWVDPGVNCRYLRLIDYYTHWRTLNTGIGTYDWTNMDAVYSAFAGKYELIYTLNGTPYYASSNPDDTAYMPTSPTGKSWEPTSYTYLTDFVDAFMARYPLVRFFEGWNEWSNSSDGAGPVSTASWRSGVTAAITMQQNYYTAIKANNPNAVVLSGSANNAPADLATYYTGVASYCDVIAAHFYAATFEQRDANIDTVKAVMSANGVGSKPLWNTETGFTNAWSGGGGSLQARTDTEQTNIIRRLFCQCLSKGIPVTIFFIWNDPEEIMGIWRNPHAKKAFI